MHTAQTGSPERRRKADHAQALRNRLQHADSHPVSARRGRDRSRTQEFFDARVTPGTKGRTNSFSVRASLQLRIRSTP